MNAKNLCEKITKMSDEKQRQLLRNFSRFEIQNKLDIFDLQKSVFHRLKQNHSDIANNILTYCSFVESIDSKIKSNQKLDIKAMSIKFKTRIAGNKRDKILDRWAIVKTLKDKQNLSFRQIAIYFKKYHKIDVAHSTLHKIWNELEK